MNSRKSFQQKRRVRAVATIAAAQAVSLVSNFASVSASPTDDTCDGTVGQNVAMPRRIDALIWAEGAVGEGYGDLGTRCWYDDDVQSPAGLGGPDCSGFVNKAWGLRPNVTTDGGWRKLVTARTVAGGTRYDSKSNERPVNNSGDFQSWSTPAWKNNTGAGYPGLEALDAVAWLHPNGVPSTGHVELVVQRESSPYAQTIEARSDAAGTAIFSGTNVVNVYLVVPGSLRYLQRNGWAPYQV